MMFNPDITKQAHEVIFSAKNTKKKEDPIFYFSEGPVSPIPCQKYLGMHLDEILNLHTHIQ